MSVCPSITRVDQSKTFEVRIMKFTPYGSPIILVFAPAVTELWKVTLSVLLTMHEATDTCINDCWNRGMVCGVCLVCVLICDCSQLPMNRVLFYTVRSVHWMTLAKIINV